MSSSRTTSTTSPLSKADVPDLKNRWGILCFVQMVLSFSQCIIALVKAVYQSSFVQQISALHDYVFYLEVFNVTKSTNFKLSKADKLDDVPSCKGSDASAPPGLDGQCSYDMASVFSNDEKCFHLHGQICSRSFGDHVDHVLTEAMDVISSKMFLNVDHMIQGGPVKKEVAIAGITNTEAVFFLQHLPKDGQDKWLPPLLKAVCNALSLHLDKEKLGVEAVHITQDAVQLRIRGVILVDLRFSPIFDSYRKVLSAQSRQGPSTYHLFQATFIKQRTLFVAKQREHVKVTIRLLKWWRDQQVWSGQHTRPSDELLELVAIHSSNTSTAFTQRKAMANAMSCLAHFDKMRIVFFDYYSENDIWQPLLPQRPLVMDPANPYINVADPQLFDSSELMSLAQAQC